MVSIYLHVGVACYLSVWSWLGVSFSCGEVYHCPTRKSTWMSCDCQHVSHDCQLCHVTASCVMWLPAVSHDCQLCHVTASCVTWLSAVSCDCQLCHMTSSCVTWLPAVSHDCQLCHVTASCVMWLPAMFTHVPCIASHVACNQYKEWMTKCQDDTETANYIIANTKDVRPHPPILSVPYCCYVAM